MSNGTQLDPDRLQTLYFLGIGGIGMSALARYFHRRGAAIYGYDRTETPLTKKLVAEGMHIHFQPDVDAIPDNLDLIVYTPAIPADHPEWPVLRNRQVSILKRAELLGLISRNQRTIAIAGTHGKTSTSSLLTHLLRSGGVDCTAFLGGIALNYESNYVGGSGDWVVAEADEFDRSFLHLRPEMAAIMSTDPDHLDIYGDHDVMVREGFRKFAGHVSRVLLLQNSVLPDWAETNTRRFGLETGDYRAERIAVRNGAFEFDFVGPKIRLEALRTNLPGRHNIENATAAIALALAAGADPKRIREGLLSFRGIRRRFERIYSDAQRVYIDDYAHHPTELRAAIGAARELYPGRKLTGLFQPHLYSRTRDFYPGFAEALDELDEVYILDIYPAWEKPIPGISSDLIFNRMRQTNKQRLSMQEVPHVLEGTQIEVLLTLGAGDIDTLVEPIAAWLAATANN